MPRVSIIVPAYNAAKVLGETLASALASTYRDYEILVIDDGATDDTAAVAARYPVRLLRQTNQGMSASRNRGIQESQSEFVALLDADDLWHPEKLARQIAALDAHPEAGLCYAEFFSWDGVAPPLFDAVVTQTLDERLSGWIYHQMILTNFVLPSSVVIRRSLIDQLGLFSCANQKTDDWEYFVRASRSVPFVKLQAPLVAYRESPTSLSKRVSPVNETESMRDELLARYGLTHPHGPTVDQQQLRWRRYKGHRDFADMHMSRGSLRLGLSGFAQLLWVGPERGASAMRLVKSAVRRVIKKRL